MTEGFFAAAPYRKLQDPLDRLLGYVDFRASILNGELPDYTCLLGTLVQETYATHPEIRAACARCLSSHIAELTRDIEAAKKVYAPRAKWSPESVGYFIQTVLQGSFIFAKAQQSPAVVRDNLNHLRRYLGVLFNQSESRSKKGEIICDS
jgi:TetR/AcrR family transcriptional repressor of nem operon